MKKLIRLLLAGAAMSVAVGASANTISYEDTFSDLDGNGTLHLTKFDSSLGTLKSVQFQLVDRLTGFMEVDNLGTRSSLFSGSLTGNLSSSFGGINLSAFTSHQFNLAPVTSQTGAGATYDIGLVTDTFATTYLTNSQLAQFIGGGALNIGVNGSVLPSFSGPANVSYYGEGSIDAYAKVVYNFDPTPVPEPDTVAILLTGMGLMAAVLRKRKPRK